MAKPCRTPTPIERREEPASEMEADIRKKLQGGSDDKVQMLQRKKWPPDKTVRKNQLNCFKVFKDCYPFGIAQSSRHKGTWHSLVGSLPHAPLGRVGGWREPGDAGVTVC